MQTPLAPSEAQLIKLVTRVYENLYTCSLPLQSASSRPQIVASRDELEEPDSGDLAGFARGHHSQPLHFRHVYQNIRVDNAHYQEYEQKTRDTIVVLLPGPGF